MKVFLFAMSFILCVISFASFALALTALVNNDKGYFFAFLLGGLAIFYAAFDTLKGV